MPNAVKKQRLFFIAGILFAFFWGSASTVTKYGLQYLQPWVLRVYRLLTSAIIMLAIAHLILGYALPQRKYFMKLTIYGFFNLSILLECIIMV